MKKEKMSLKSVKNVLSRAEMKKIMAGSGNCLALNSACGAGIQLPCCPESVCSAQGGIDLGTCVPLP